MFNLNQPEEYLARSDSVSEYKTGEAGGKFSNFAKKCSSIVITLLRAVHTDVD